MLTLFVDTALYGICEKAAQNMACSKKKDFFGRGCINNASDPYRAERTGRLGEVPLAFYLGVEPDLSYHKDGDKTDLVYNGAMIDVKTNRYNSGKGYIRAITEWGRPVELTSDIYVFAYIDYESRSTKQARVVYAGFLYANEVIRTPVLSPRGKHYNYVVHYPELHPIELFLGGGFNDKVVS